MSIGAAVLCCATDRVQYFHGLAEKKLKPKCIKLPTQQF